MRWERPPTLLLKVLPVRITAGESVRAATLALQFKTVTLVAVRRAALREPGEGGLILR